MLVHQYELFKILPNESNYGFRRFFTNCSYRLLLEAGQLNDLIICYVDIGTARPNMPPCYTLCPGDPDPATLSCISRNELQNAGYISDIND